MAGLLDRIRAYHDAYHDPYDRKVDVAFENERLSPQEIESMMEKMRNNYGVDFHYKELERHEEPAALGTRQLSPVQLQAMANQKGRTIEEQRKAMKDGTVYAHPLKGTLLHEAGHIADQNLNPRHYQVRGLLNAGGKVAGVGGVAAPLVAGALGSDEQTQTLATGGALAIGTGMTIGKHMMVNRAEDRANSFAKKYMADELGNEQAAKKWFDDSYLNDARKSYGRSAVYNTGKTVGIGVGAGLAGLALNHLKNKWVTQSSSGNNLGD